MPAFISFHIVLFSFFTLAAAIALKESFHSMAQLAQANLAQLVISKGEQTLE